MAAIGLLRFISIFQLDNCDRKICTLLDLVMLAQLTALVRARVTILHLLVLLAVVVHLCFVTIVIISYFLFVSVCIVM
jgi:hypothetical protein